VQPRFLKSATWLLAIGCVFFRCWAGPGHSSRPLEPPTILKEFQENGPPYFPAGTFKKPDGSPDDQYGESLGGYLRSIGEPPLLRSADNSQAHAYRLMIIGFPVGRTWVLRLQMGDDGSAKLFARETPFNGTNLLLNKQDSVSITDVNAFLECVKRADFWRLPTLEDPDSRIKDGSYWFLEGTRRGDYHMVYRRSPELHPGKFTNVGRYLAKDLAHLDGSTIYIPRGDRSEPLRRGDHP
jgi:hypothetical protein